MRQTVKSVPNGRVLLISLLKRNRIDYNASTRATALESPLERVLGLFLSFLTAKHSRIRQRLFHDILAGNDAANDDIRDCISTDAVCTVNRSDDLPSGK